MILLVNLWNKVKGQRLPHPLQIKQSIPFLDLKQIEPLLKEGKNVQYVKTDSKSTKMQFVYHVYTYCTLTPLFFWINCVVMKTAFYHGLKSTVPVLFVVILLMGEKDLMIHHHHLLTTLVRHHRHLHIPRGLDTVGHYQIYSISEVIGIQVREHRVEVLPLTNQNWRRNSMPPEEDLD